MELILKLYALGSHFFNSGWNVMGKSLVYGSIHLLFTRIEIHTSWKISCDLVLNNKKRTEMSYCMNVAGLISMIICWYSVGPLTF